MTGSHRAALIVAVLLSVLLVGACDRGNYSSPTLTISSASVRRNLAVLNVEISNPSDFDLILRRIEYTLSYGLAPVAQGEFPGMHQLPAGQSVSIRFPVTFDTQPIGAQSDLELSGQMHFDDTSNRERTRIASSAFRASASIEQ